MRNYKKVSIIVLFASGLLLACSEVRLNYGLGGSGLTAVSDRNRNASTPANIEDLEGQKLEGDLPQLNVGDSGDSGDSSSSPGQQTPVSDANLVPAAIFPISRRQW